MQRALIAAASLVFPPTGVLALRSPLARGGLLAASAVAAVVFFGVWMGPGALLWGVTGLVAALMVLLARP